MTRTRALAALVAGLLATAVLTGCGSLAPERPSLDPATAEVRYEYHDSSVPPEYHRSYTLTVRATGARLVVDSYGEVLHDVTADVPADTWTTVRENVAGLAGFPSDSPDDGCPGGTAQDLVASSGGSAVLDLHTENCAGHGDGRAVADAVRPALALFDLDTLLQTG